MASGVPPSPQSFTAPTWQLQPSLLKLRRVVANEQACCWALVVIAGLSFMPIGYWLGVLLLSAFPTLMALSSQAMMPTQVQSAIAPFLPFGMIGGPLAMFSSLLIPLAVVLWGVMVYRRMLRMATSDFVWGQAALMLTDDGYGKLIEEARREQFRPTVNPVEIGNGLITRLNHFAHYYSSYYRLSRGPCELKLPIVIERNCWLDGVPAGLGGCLNGCVGIGLPLAILMLLRIVLTWPRLVAIKQAALDYFAGRYDHLLEQQYQAAVAGKQSA